MSLFIVLPPVGEPYIVDPGEFPPSEEIEIVEKAMQSCIQQKINPYICVCPYKPHIDAPGALTGGTGWRSWLETQILLEDPNAVVYYDENEPRTTGIPNVLVRHEPGGRVPFFGALVLKVPSPTFLGC